MAASLGNHLFGHIIEFGSVGVRGFETNPFAIAIMDEIGIDLTTHVPRSFQELDGTPCDLVISLTPEAQHHAIELTRSDHCEAEYWATHDPSLVHGSRNTVLEAFREVRETLSGKITTRFEQGPVPDY